MALWRLYYHLVWATKDRLPLITAPVEPVLYGYMIGKTISLGAMVHAIGGIDTHVHMVASIPPKLAIATFVQKIKGSSAHYMNHGPETSDVTFAWQRGYGVFSLGAKQLDDAITYVRCQKEHHRAGDLLVALERDDTDDDAPRLYSKGSAIEHIRVIHP